MKDTQSGVALLPFLVFVIIFLGSGIILDDFYAFPASVAALCGVISAFLLPKASFQEKLKFFMKGCGEESIITMCIIYLLAGAFSAVSKATGSIDAVVYFGSQYFSAQYIPLGVFLMASFLSVSAGTSVGTIVALTPIVMGFAENTQTDINVVAASLLCGAMFGDNLSFISDTTIAATKTQGVEMKDKFKVNFKIAFPAAIVTLAILFFTAIKGSSAEFVNNDYNVLQAIPYFLVLVASICGINVFIVLGCGSMLSGIVGIATHSLTVSSAFSSMGEGVKGMFETMVVTILVASMGALMKEYGGFEWILQTIKKGFRSRRGGMLGIGLLTSMMDVATANNTVAIVMAGPIAKEISEEYNISPKKTASLMDVFSCICQGIIPYGAQLLIASGIAKITSVSIIPFLFYQFLLLVFVVISILFDRERS